MADEEGYSGAAVLEVDGREIAVQVVLDARHEPQDGKLHWFGRLRPEVGTEPGLLQALMSTASAVELRTGGGRALARVGEVDPWGRYRVTGVGTPPYVRHSPEPDD